MSNSTKGIGCFTAENIVAVLKALPETDGTYGEVAARAREHGGDIPRHTLGRWASSGRADIKAGKHQTAFARFAQRFDQLKEEHCDPDANRNREFNRALEILEHTCECGNQKILEPDGTLPDRCRECQETDARAPRRRGSG